MDRNLRDVVLAAVDVIGRSGAAGFEIGHLDEDTTPGRWWAKTRLADGVVVTSGSDYEGQDLWPWEAADALVGKVLYAATCVGCGRPIWPDLEFNTRHDVVDGELRPRKRPRRWCRWSRHGDHWEGACGRGAR